MSTKSAAAADFEASLEAELSRISSERSKIILQMTAASLDGGRLDQLKRRMDRFPDGSPRKTALDLNDLPAQLAAAVPQILALDLDRVSALRILGLGRGIGNVLFCAKTLGHDVIAACRADFLNKSSLWLYSLPHFDRGKTRQLPEGQFNLIMCAGGPMGTRKAWVNFLAPLADKLSDGGRLFMTLPKEAEPEKNYYPDVTMSKLAGLGVRVSSKNHFLLFDRATISNFGFEIH